MWKLLRNLALVGVLLTGAVQFSAWFAARRALAQWQQALQPAAELRYDGLRAGLDGSIGLSGVTLAHATGHRIYRADRLTFATPGLVWLLRHALLHENTWPAEFALEIEGLKLPPLPGLDPQWFDSTTFVPFGGIGCGKLGPAELGKIGLPETVPQVQAKYRHAPETNALHLDFVLSAPGIVQWTLHAELRPLAPASLLQPAAWERAHVESLTVELADAGFFALRNRYCAKRLGEAPRQFLEAHLAELRNLLEQHHVVASDEVLQLYRTLLENGGEARLLSLPNAGFTLGDLHRLSPTELLRQLNVTARYRDRPPIMFRLSFTTPPTEQEPSPAVVDAANRGTTATAAGFSTAPSPATATAPATASPPPRSELPSPATAAAANRTAENAPHPTPTPSPTSTATSRQPARSDGDGSALDELDRAVARYAPTAASIPSRKNEPRPSPELASSPPPPPDSTLALVWKPTIERLPPPPPEPRDYDPIEFAGLKNLTGRRVRLVTDGGKRIEGYVIAADDVVVQLRIHRADGDFTFEVPKSRVQQVQLLHGWPAG